MQRTIPKSVTDFEQVHNGLKKQGVKTAACSARTELSDTHTISKNETTTKVYPNFMKIKSSYTKKCAYLICDSVYEYVPFL